MLAQGLGCVAGQFVTALEALGEPVSHRIPDRVTPGRLETRFEFFHGLDQLVFDDSPGPAPALETPAVARAVEAEADRADVPVVLRVDRGLVLAD